MTHDKSDTAKRRMSLRLLLPLTLAAALLLAAPAAAAKKRSIYLSLGDSLAWGYTKAADGTAVQSNRDFSSILTAKARRMKRYPRRLRLHRLGCPGETTVTYRSGGKCEYAGFESQAAAAQRFIMAKRRRIAFITLSLGGNSFSQCVRGLTVNADCLNATADQIGRDIGLILRALRRAAGKHVPIAVTTLHDPFLALWFHGGEHRDSALATLEAIKRANVEIRRAAAGSRARVGVADVFRSFRTGAMDRTVKINGQDVPLAVWKACTLTLMCRSEPVGPDMHPTAAGYRNIARKLARTLDVRWKVSR